jgi:glycosyltransferase involved in cell wall biosynthesis
MHVIIQIPCLNEEQTLPDVLDDLPSSLSGVDNLEIVVIDDGSTDETAEIARQHGCTVLSHNENKGLGTAFETGLDYARDQGVDALINTDGDHQYPGKHVEDVLRPVLEGQADMVLGDRQPHRIEHFSAVKRFFQYLGSKVTSFLVGLDLNDPITGFRAYSKEAIERLTITTKFSYVLDTLMQAKTKQLTITQVPITTNPPKRESRLFSSIWEHIFRSGTDLLRLFVVYKPFTTFAVLAAAFLIPGFLLGTRFLYFYAVGQGSGHIQSLIATAILILTAVILFAIGILGEILRMNRKLLDKVLSRR